MEDTVFQINKCSLKKYDANVIIDSMNIDYCV